jgi:thioredoxin reductase
MNQDWDVETDFLVVGGGGCGLMAAFAAARTGVDVMPESRVRMAPSFPICMREVGQPQESRVTVSTAISPATVS